MPHQTMQGRIALITGSTDGIGKQTALALARLGATVVVHGRNPERAQAAAAALQKASGSSDISWVAADLASLPEIRQMATTVAARHPQLHVLINNAGIYMRQRQTTAQGMELTFAVNYLATYQLTNLLLDCLASGAREDAPARVINVSSMVHQSGTPEFDSLARIKNFDGYAAYADSKLAVVMFTYALARRVQNRFISANCLHPGVINTKLLHAGFQVQGHSVEDGAETPVYLATSPEVENITGQYYAKKTALASSPDSYDETFQNDLWQRSEAWTAGN